MAGIIVKPRSRILHGHELHLAGLVVDVEVQVDLAFGQVGDHLLRGGEILLHLRGRRAVCLRAAQEARPRPRGRSQGDEPAGIRLGLSEERHDREEK